MPLVRKRRDNPAMVAKAMPIVVTAVQSVAAGRMAGSDRCSSRKRNRRLTAVQTVRAPKASLNHNGATIAVRNVATTGRIMAGNATVLVATTL